MDSSEDCRSLNLQDVKTMKCESCEMLSVFSKEEFMRVSLCSKCNQNNELKRIIVSLEEHISLLKSKIQEAFEATLMIVPTTATALCAAPCGLANRETLEVAAARSRFHVGLPTSSPLSSPSDKEDMVNTPSDKDAVRNTPSSKSLIVGDYILSDVDSVSQSGFPQGSTDCLKMMKEDLDDVHLQELTEMNLTAPLGCDRNGEPQFKLEDPEMVPVSSGPCSVTTELCEALNEEPGPSNRNFPVVRRDCLKMMKEEQDYRHLQELTEMNMTGPLDCDRNGEPQFKLEDQEMVPVTSGPCNPTPKLSEALNEESAPSKRTSNTEKDLKKQQQTHHHCSESGQSFTTSRVLKIHQRAHTGEKPYHCSQCGKSFSRMGTLEIHQRVHTGEKPYHCSQCGKRFSGMGNLETHQRVHSGEKPYHCSQCGKSFSQMGNLETHQRVHSGEKPYHCSQCGKGFTERGTLQRHQRVHTGEKPYHCSQCGKSFTRIGNMQKHKRLHTAEKPYHCSQCGKSFTTSGNLDVHQRVHSGEKPYHCSQCGKGFTQRGSLRRHQRVHTGEKPYHCSECGKSFTRIGNMQKHKRLHTAEKPYHCSQCGTSFDRIEHLQRHQRIHTGEKP